MSNLGFPSTKSTFGKKKLITNDVLILEFNNKGILVKKDFLSMNDMNKLKIIESNTVVANKKNTFISTFVSSLRQKINDPLGVKKAK